MFFLTGVGFSLILMHIFKSALFQRTWGVATVGPRRVIGVCA